MQIHRVLKSLCKFINAQKFRRAGHAVTCVSCQQCGVRAGGPRDPVQPDILKKKKKKRKEIKCKPFSSVEVSTIVYTKTTNKSNNTNSYLW
jgi:hypothetical protein